MKKMSFRNEREENLAKQYLVNNTIFDAKSGQSILALLAQDTSLLTQFKLDEWDFIISKHLIEITASDHEVYETTDYQKIFGLIKSAYASSKAVMSADEFSSQVKPEEFESWIKGAKIENAQYYYDSVRKATILREADHAGIKLDKYMWFASNDLEAHKAFDEVTVNKLLDEVSTPIGNVVVEQAYGSQKNKWDNTVDSPEILLERFITKTPWGHTTNSPFLNAIIHGWQRGLFYEIIASSGAGKSMMNFSNIGLTYAPKIYKDGKWVETGNTDSCLYIGTEMDIEDNWLPQIVSCVSENNYYKVTKHDFNDEEFERYHSGFKVLYDSPNISLVKEADYDLAKLSNLCNMYIRRNNISTVFLDYMEVTSALMDTKAEDFKILNNLATFCKDVLTAKDIGVVAFAQANGDLTDRKLSEIDADCIKGSHTLHHKADVLMYLIPGGENDREYLDRANPIGHYISDKIYQFKDKGIYKVSAPGTVGLELNPARIRKILIGDKCRPDTSKRGYCVWCFVEEGTLRWHDLFVTDSNYKLVDIDPVYLPLDESKKGVVDGTELAG